MRRWSTTATSLVAGRLLASRRPHPPRTPDNTWRTVDIPAYNLVGSEEADSNVHGTIEVAGRRLQPFERYPEVGDKLLTVVDGQDHAEMWNRGDELIERYVAEKALAFLRVYVDGNDPVDPCSIGAPTDDVSVTTWRIAEPGGRLASCPDERAPR